MDTSTKTEIVIARFDNDMYKKLEERFPAPIVTDKTTDIQAGYQIGVQAVLKVLRDGYVVGER